MLTTTQVGLALVTVGVVITGYHSDKLLSTTHRKHLFWALVGVVSFGIGQNLIADTLHDKLTKG